MALRLDDSSFEDPADEFGLGVRVGLAVFRKAARERKLLNLLARALGAKAILEFGALGGYSTIWLGRALAHDGRPREHRPGRAEREPGRCAATNLETGTAPMIAT